MPTTAVNAAAAVSLRLPNASCSTVAAVGYLMNGKSPPKKPYLVVVEFPLAKALIQKSSETINFVGSSTMEVLERPEMLSPKAVQVIITDQMYKLVSSVKNAKLDLMVLGGSNKKEFTSSSTDKPEANTGSHTEQNLG